MYKVAIIDDEKVFADEQKRICTNIFNKHEIEYHIDVFNNSIYFFESFSKQQHSYDLILLDIVMDEMNGMELAVKIRNHNNNVSIIFITSTNDFVFQGYDVNALHYLLKPLDEDQLEKLILSDYNNKFLNNFFIYKSGTENIRISINEIINAETVGRRVAVTLTNKTVFYPGKLSELLKKLPGNRFVQCHKSYIINLYNINELTRQHAIAINGTTTPISRTYSNDVQKAFLRIIREN